MMDQATQVNFPTVTKYPRKRLQRHNTTADLRLNSPITNTQTTPPPFWITGQNSLPTVIQPTIKVSSRPRSLHLSTEAFQKSRLSYGTNETVISRLTHPNEIAEELSLKVIPPDHTPPYSSNSSIIMSGYSKGKTSTQSSPKLFSHGTTSATQHFLNIPTYGAVYQTSEGTNSMSSCKCFSEPTDISGGDPNQPRIPTVTPEGLSWRRLHMSRAKLKATSTTSELLSGFAMVAMVELQINEDTAVPEWLFVMFSVCTTVLVAVHIFALMISTYILPNIDAISKLDVCELVKESPHERMNGFIELAWAFSTVLGLFLFLVEVAILCWVKFWDYSFTAAIAATVIVIPVLIIFVLFAVHFYHSLVVYKCDASFGDMQKLEDMKRQLDEVTSPV